MQVLLVEDDALTAQVVTETLAREGVEARLAGDAETALSLAGRDGFDVIIMDRMLPGMDGVSAIARLRRAGVTKPILMLSALGRSEHRVEGLDGGADDYLTKPFEPSELVARLRALHRRGQALAHQPILIHGELELNVKARTAHRAGRHLALSPKEFELLHYLMQNAGALVTRQMLLQNVWKLNFDPQTNVIDVNLVRLRRKLEEEGEAAVLETVRGQGYRLKPLA